MIIFTKSNKAKKWFRVIRKKYIFNPVLDIPWTPCSYNRNLDEFEKFPWNLKNEGDPIDLTIKPPRNLPPVHSIFKIIKNPKALRYVEEMSDIYPSYSRLHLDADLLLSSNNVESEKIFFELKVRRGSLNRDNEENEEEQFESLDLSTEYPTSTQDPENEPKRSKIKILSNELISSSTTSIQSNTITSATINDTKETSSIKAINNNVDDNDANAGLSSQTPAHTANRNQEKASSSTEIKIAHSQAVTGLSSKYLDKKSNGTTNQEEITTDFGLSLDLTIKKSDQPLHVFQTINVSEIKVHNDILANTSETEIPLTAADINLQDNFDSTNELHNSTKENKTLPNKTESSNPHDNNCNSLTELPKLPKNVPVDETISQNHKTSQASKELLPLSTTTNDKNNTDVFIDKNFEATRPAISYDDVIACIPQEVLFKLHKHGIDIRQNIFDVMAKYTRPQVVQNYLRANTNDAQSGIAAENKILNVDYFNVSRQIPNPKTQDGIDLNQVGNTDTIASSSNMELAIPINVLVRKNQKIIEHTTNTITDNTPLPIFENAFRNNPFDNMEVRNYIVAMQNSYRNPNNYINEARKVNLVNTIAEQALQTSWSALPQHHSPNVPIKPSKVNATNKRKRTNLPERVSPLFNENQIRQTQKYVDDVSKNLPYMSRNPIYMSRNSSRIPTNPGIQNFEQNIPANLIPRYSNTLLDPNMLPQTHPYLNEPTGNFFSNDGQIVHESPGIRAMPNSMHSIDQYTNMKNLSHNNNQNRSNQQRKMQPRVNSTGYYSDANFNNISGSQQRVNPSAVIFSGAERVSSAKGYDNAILPLPNNNQIVPNITNPIYANFLEPQNGHGYGNLNDNQGQYRQHSDVYKMPHATISTRQNSLIQNGVRGSNVQNNNVPILPTYEAAVKNSTFWKKFPNVHHNPTDTYRTTEVCNKMLPVIVPNPLPHTILNGNSNEQDKFMPKHEDSMIRLSVATNKEKGNRLAVCADEMRLSSDFADNIEKNNTLLAGDSSKKTNPVKINTNINSSQSSELTPINTVDGNNELANMNKILSLKQISVSSIKPVSHKSPPGNKVHNKATLNRLPKELRLQRPYISKAVDSSLRDLAEQHHSPKSTVKSNSDELVNSSDQTIKYFQDSLHVNQDNDAEEIPDRESTLAPSKSTMDIDHVSKCDDNPKKRITPPTRCNGEETINNYQSSNSPILIRLPDELPQIKSLENRVTDNCTLKSSLKDQNGISSQKQHDDKGISEMSIHANANKENNVASDEVTEDITAMLALSDHFKRKEVFSSDDNTEDSNPLADAINDTCSSLLFLMNNFQRFKSLLNTNAGKYLKHKFVLSNSGNSNKSSHKLLNDSSKRSSPSRLQSVTIDSSELAQDEYSSNQNLPEITDVTENGDSLDPKNVYLLSGTLQYIQYREDDPCISVQERDNELAYNISTDITKNGQSFDERIIINLLLADDVRKWVEIILINYFETATMRVDRFNDELQSHLQVVDNRQSKPNKIVLNISKNNDCVEEKLDKIQHTRAEHKMDMSMDLNEKIDFNYNYTKAQLANVNTSVTMSSPQDISNDGNSPKKFGRTPFRSDCAIPERENSSNQTMSVSGSASLKRSRIEALSRLSVITKRSRNKTASSSDPSNSENFKNQPESVPTVSNSSKNEAISSSVSVITELSRNETISSSDTCVTENSRNPTLSFSGSASPKKSRKEALSSSVRVKRNRSRNKTASNFDPFITRNSRNQTLSVSGPAVSKRSENEALSSSVPVITERLRNDTSFGSRPALIDRSEEVTSVSDFSKSESCSGKSVRPSKSNKRQRATLQPADSSCNDNTFSRNARPSKRIKMLITKENKKYSAKLL